MAGMSAVRGVFAPLINPQRAGSVAIRSCYHSGVVGGVSFSYSYSSALRVRVGVRVRDSISVSAIQYRQDLAAESRKVLGHLRGDQIPVHYRGLVDPVRAGVLHVVFDGG